ncbi:hypothetical protein OAN31_05870, partial [Pseudomonadales bacterium]|nr:hypothetical protein [Pseudomonadales bacterium]
IARDIARVNSKNEEVTSRDGHVMGYICNFKWTLGGGNSVTLQTAPNTWKMRNAFRKFHAYRDIMFENAGVEGGEKGRYGKTIRPLLDNLMDSSPVGTNVLDPFTYTGAQTASGAPASRIYEGGEWSYSQLATTPIYEEGVPVDPALDFWADAFNLHICDENVVSDFIPGQSSGYYKSVGMIHSYNLDRMEVVTPTTAETISGPSNPLAALISSGNQATGEVIDIAENLELEKPPYDLDDNGDSIFMNVEGYGETRSTGGTVSFSSFVPAGLCRYFLPAEVTASLEITVLGKVLCKDMA